MSETVPYPLPPIYSPICFDLSQNFVLQVENNIFPAVLAARCGSETNEI